MENNVWLYFYKGTQFNLLDALEKINVARPFFSDPYPESFFPATLVI